MTGLDKIVSQILEDAGKEADEIVQKAQNDANKILSDAKESCQKIEDEAAAKWTADELNYKERVRSSAELKKRQAILLQKQQIIAEMLEQAYETLLFKKTEEYFVLIRKMLKQFVLAKQGELYFSERDLDRMPDGFEAEVEEIAASKGGSLLLMKEPKNIDGGFILVYGGIEENCSFKALFLAQKDRILDKVHELLFL